jgi:DNA-binding transcriptional LysR family regulator
MLANYAGRILELWREAGEEMATLQGVFAGTLRVGAVTTAEYLLPPLLVTFANQNPKVKVKLQVGNRDEIVRLLAGQEIDVAIMGRPPSELKTTSIAFAKHPMAFVASPTHPAMSDPNLSIATLSGAHLLVRERGSGTRTTVERLFKDAGVPMRIGSEMSSNEAMRGWLRCRVSIAAHMRSRNQRRPVATASNCKQPDRAELVRDASRITSAAARGGGLRDLLGHRRPAPRRIAHGKRGLSRPGAQVTQTASRGRVTPSDQAALFTQALHQPLLCTALPANS